MAEETATDPLLRRVAELAAVSRERRIAERDFTRGQATMEFEPVQEQLVA